MGCCQSRSFTKNVTEHLIKEIIQVGNAIRLRNIYSLIKKQDPNFDINSIVYQIDNKLSVTALGYALLSNQPNVFSVIMQSMGGDFTKMEKLFAKAGSSSLEIICLNNFTPLLQSYLPYYLSELKKTKNSVAKEPTSALLELMTPIQLSCMRGHISIINSIRNYTLLMESIPIEIDIHHTDETTGNNCALIACKSNNYNMIIFLHTKCNADFSVINKYNENAINILAIGSCNNPSETAKCLEYLVTVAEIDITFNYQETLIMLQEPGSIKLVENYLKEKEIFVSKTDLDHNIINKSNRGTFSSCISTGNRFTFVKLFPELNVKGSWASNDIDAVKDLAISPSII